MTTLLGKADGFIPDRECYCQLSLRQNEPLNFSWHDLENSNSRALNTFQKVCDVKDHLLLRCERCGRHWFLYLNGYGFAWALSDSELVRINDWARRDLKPSPTAMKTLISIGEARYRSNPEDLKLVANQTAASFKKIAARFKLSPERQSLWAENSLRSVPCRVVDRKGNIHDPALVCMDIPLVESLENKLFFDDIVLVEPSPFTFSLAVREAALDAEEIVMGSALMMVEALTGQRYVTDARALCGRAGNQLASTMTFVSGRLSETRYYKDFPGFEIIEPIDVLAYAAGS